MLGAVVYSEIFVVIAIVVGADTRVVVILAMYWLWETVVGMIMDEDRAEDPVVIVRSRVSRLTKDGNEGQTVVVLRLMILVEVMIEVWSVVAVTRLVLFTTLVMVEDIHLVENLVSTCVVVLGVVVVSQNFKQLPTLQSSCLDKRVTFRGLMPSSTATDAQNNPHTTNMLEVFRSTVDLVNRMSIVKLGNKLGMFGDQSIDWIMQSLLLQPPSCHLVCWPIFH